MGGDTGIVTSSMKQDYRVVDIQYKDRTLTREHVIRRTVVN
jgi:hypothetical protein